ncbi:MAG: zeta toxin family protein [Gammaproteobacteria bacterium]|nr:zeta toxin family protein [Gammaproteobacteria bacterium]
MTTVHQPICRIIAGPNGAGKTTFALKYLPLVHCRRFVNADLIAAGLSPLAAEEQAFAASRLFLREITRHSQARHDFAFETTLSGRTYLRFIERLRAQGWRVELLYLALPSVEISQLRVTERVVHGGHAIPPVDIARRFPRSLRNLFGVYADAVDYACCFLNTCETPELIFTRNGDIETIFQNEIYQQLLHEAQ